RPHDSRGERVRGDRVREEEQDQRAGRGRVGRFASSADKSRSRCRQARDIEAVRCRRVHEGHREALLRVVRGSLFVACCSLFVVRCSLFVVRKERTTNNELRTTNYEQRIASGQAGLPVLHYFTATERACLMSVTPFSDFSSAS